MKAGTYRARWIGTVQPGASAGPLGFVDVWAGDQRLARREVLPAEVQADRRELATIEFVLPKPTSRLDYRLWIDGHSPVTLERVELMSTSVDRASSNR